MNQEELELTRPLRFVVCVMMLVIVFEGLLRKLTGGGSIGLLIFFFKDFIALATVPLVARAMMPRFGDIFSTAVRLLLFLLFPLVGATALHDPLLALFGFKQYVLFSVMGFATIIGFAPLFRDDLHAYLRWAACLVIPTALVAMLQLNLPTDHWLNSSTTGDSLDDFSAGGRLRVTSTFSFCAQFSFFLNAMTGVYLAALTLKSRHLPKWWLLTRWIIAPLLIISTFASGNRGAVVGAVAIIVVGSVAVGMRGRPDLLAKLAAIVMLLLGAISLLQYVAPQYFEAYNARVEGTNETSHNKEITLRIIGIFTEWFTYRDFGSTAFGYGLGTMSNGSDQISDYAKTIRATLGWGETDLANTYLEGGIYLMLIWYGFRLYVIGVCWSRYFNLKDSSLQMPAAFLLSFITVLGISETLGIQPPIAIYWWICVGLVNILCQQKAEYSDDDSGESNDDPNEKLPSRLRGRSIYSEHLHS